jgi:hypothetical protein
MMSDDYYDYVRFEPLDSCDDSFNSQECSFLPGRSFLQGRFPGADERGTGRVAPSSSSTMSIIGGDDKLNIQPSPEPLASKSTSLLILQDFIYCVVNFCDNCQKNTYRHLRRWLSLLPFRD